MYLWLVVSGYDEDTRDVDGGRQDPGQVKLSLSSGQEDQQMGWGQFRRTANCSTLKVKTVKELISKKIALGGVRYISYFQTEDLRNWTPLSVSGWISTLFSGDHLTTETQTCPASSAERDLPELPRKLMKIFQMKIKAASYLHICKASENKKLIVKSQK